MKTVDPALCVSTLHMLKKKKVFKFQRIRMGTAYVYYLNTMGTPINYDSYSSSIQMINEPEHLSPSRKGVTFENYESFSSYYFSYVRGYQVAMKDNN